MRDICLFLSSWTQEWGSSFDEAFVLISKLNWIYLEAAQSNSSLSLLENVFCFLEDLLGQGVIGCFEIMEHSKEKITITHDKWKKLVRKKGSGKKKEKRFDEITFEQIIITISEIS